MTWTLTEKASQGSAKWKMVSNSKESTSTPQRRLKASLLVRASQALGHGHSSPPLLLQNHFPPPAAPQALTKYFVLHLALTLGGGGVYPKVKM